MPVAGWRAWWSYRSVRWGALALACIVGGAAAARAALPSLLGWALTRAIAQATGMRARVGDVTLWVWGGEARVRGLRVTHPRSGTPVAGWDGLRVRIRYAPLLQGVLRVQSMAVDRPFIVLTRGAGDAIPFSAFAVPRPRGALPLDIALGELEVARGQITVHDAAGPGRTLRLEDVAVRLADLATGPPGTGRKTSLAISARWEGAQVQATGWVRPFAAPFEADLALRLADLELPRLDALLDPGGARGSPPAARRVTFRGGRASVLGHLVRGDAGGTQIAATLDLQRPSVALGEGPDLVSATSLRLVADRFDVEALILREARVEVEGLEGDLGHLAGLAARAASLRAAVASLDIARGAARALKAEAAGVALGEGGDGPRLEAARIRASAEAIELHRRAGRRIALEGDALAFRGIGGPAAAGTLGTVRAAAEWIDGAARSARGIRFQAERLAGTGLGPPSLAAQVRSVRAAADGLAPGARGLQEVSFALEGAAASRAGSPLGSLEALRGTAASLDVAARSGTGVSLEADQLAIAGLGPQAVAARVRGLRATAESAALRGPAIRKASLAVEWLAAAREGDAEPFAVLRGARAEVPRVDLAALLSPAPPGAAPVALEVARLEVDAPSVRVRRDAAGIDLAHLLDARVPSGRAGPAGGGGGGPAIEPSAVAVGIAQIHEGAITFTDATVSPEASLALRDVTLNLLNVRPGAAAPATLVVSAQVGGAGSFQLGAQFTPGTFHNANGTARLEGIDVDLARPYLRLPAPLAAITGRVTASAEARAAPPPAGRGAGGAGVAPAWKIVASAEARGLAGRDSAGAVLVEVPALDVREVEVTVPDFSVVVGDVDASGVRLPVERDAAGVVRIAGLPLSALRPRPAGASSPGPGPGPARGQRRPAGGAPRVRVRQIRVTATVPLVDRARPQPLETAITDVVLELHDVGTVGENSMGLRLRGRLEEMTFAAAGATRFGPLQGLAYLDLQSLDLVRWADYLPDAVRGRLADLRGEAHLEVTFGPALSDLAVRGRVEAAPLQLADPEGEDGIVGVERATLAIERLTLVPLSLHLGAVVLDQPWVNLERRADGRINVLALVPPHAPAAAGAGGAGAWATISVTIDHLTVKDGIFDVADRTASPAFVEQLKAVSGGVEGLSTDGSSRASFNLAGRLSDNSALAIQGEAIPRMDRPSVDFRARLTGFNLSGLSPYVRRLTSSRIERGRIELEAHYRLEARQLEGENHIRLDQLEVGDPEEWPDRFTDLVGVSLSFAVSLLQDSEGVIQLDIPVRGDVGHPEFDFGDAVQTAIQNAVVATVTAPFRWIGKIFEAAGRIGEIDIAPILFAPGSDRLDKEGQQAVGRLVAFLREAPRARIRLAGYAEPAEDGNALRATDAARPGSGGIVRRLARRLGLGAKPPPGPDLEGLARRRSLAVYEGLLRAEVDPQRLFLGEATVEEARVAAERGKAPQGRVEFQFVY